MSLSKYKAKRSFKSTPEPQGGKAKSSLLHFVVQKHRASHLHYDFRLEMDNVLKSWAVPKGPSMDSKIKRLAMMVEDHPIDYANFEGIIPEGNYGAGAVMVWDNGEYEVESDSKLSKKEQNDILLKELKAGKLKFILHGKKLKGLFALVKAKNKEDNSWFFMKLKDKYESNTDIALQDQSVLSKKTMEEISGNNSINQSAKKKSLPKSKTITSEQKKRSVKKISKTDSTLHELTKDSPNTKFPSFIFPMLTTLVDKPFDHEGWEYELKWDGYRTLAFINNDHVDLKSRNDISFNEKFYSIRKLLSEWNIKAVVDGEIVVLNNEGVPSFGKLQNWKSEADGKLIYYIFDVLWFEGKDLTHLPFTTRRKILENIIPAQDDIKISESFKTKGTEFYSTAKSLGMEGIIAKKSNSLYHPGERTSEWLKIKINKRQEVVIGGYTQNQGSSKSFSALLVGVYRNGKLHYIGKIGTGFTDKMQKEILSQLKKKVSINNPFINEPDVNKPSRFNFNPKASVTWLR
ncbi:MAG TPA: non-homologous end-joining DNA ligase, partial [Cyclobacteriaceae bacterium]